MYTTYNPLADTQRVDFRPLPPQHEPPRHVKWLTLLLFLGILVLIGLLVFTRMKMQEAAACKEYTTRTIEHYTYNNGTTTEEVTDCLRYK